MDLNQTVDLSENSVNRKKTLADNVLRSYANEMSALRKGRVRKLQKGAATKGQPMHLMRTVISSLWRRRRVSH